MGTTTLRKYYYAGSQRIAMREGSGTGTSGLIWLLSDHLAPCAALQGCYASSTTVSVTAAGQVSEQRYTPWGEERYTSGGALPTSFRYTGQREEADLGLYYYGARWYDPALGHFVQADSIVPLASQGTQAWDRYAYTSNNPSNYIDPTGHWPDWLDNAIDYVAGAAYQYANDMSFGTLDKVAYSANVCIECNTSDSFKKGQDAGRTVVVVQSVVEQTVGAVTTGVALAAIPPTVGGGAVCTAGTAGVCALPAGGLVVVEGAIAATGALEAAHGANLSQYAANNPANGMSNKLNHIFGKKEHNLNNLLDSFGRDEQKAYDAVNREFSKVAGNYSADELSKGIQVTVGKFTVTVRGRVVGTDAKIGTFFIP